MVGFSLYSHFQKINIMAKKSVIETQTSVDFETFKENVINDYKLATLSREASLLGRREVLTGKAKFGIFGDGKESKIITNEYLLGE